MSEKTFSRNVYQLPFENFSLKPERAQFHEHSWMQYALDFAMPIGTSLYAALEGEVVEVSDGFVIGGPDTSLVGKVNMIVIAHEQDEFTHYGHLSAGIKVRRKRMVERGDLLGYSGLTGYTTYPHLHFSVSILDSNLEYKTIVPRFKRGQEIFTLESPRT